MKELLSYLTGNELQETLVRGSTKLLVIDSIAALIRKEPFTEVDRDIITMQLASALKVLASSFHLVVLATNQIAISSTSVGSMTDFQPMLGIAWGHSVTTSLRMATYHQHSDNSDGAQYQLRRFK